jgi:O-antigen ligase
MLFSEILSLSLPLYLSVGGLGLLALPWLIRLPRLAIATLLLSLVLGQAVRFTLPNQGGGVLFSDIAVVVVLLSVAVRLMWSFNRQALIIVCLFSPFILWSLYSLVINSSQLGIFNTALSFSYWIRLSTQLLLLPALLFLLRDQRVKKTTYYSLLITLVILLALGLIQLLLLPSLTELAPFGWDPHQHRLVSTWLDPNFFGAFLVITWTLVLPSLVGLGFAKKQRSKQIAFNVFLALIPPFSFIALFFTQSRSSLLALVITGLIASPFILLLLVRKAVSVHLIVIVLSLIMVTLILFSTGAFFLKSRLYGLLTVDATAQLRLESIQQAWTLAEQNAWLGVGYNAYQFAAFDAGLISNFYIHSRAGADNSLLTLWITVGLPGLILFFTPFAIIMHILIRRWLLLANSLALAAIISTAALLLHSQFINSLLYSHLLITLIIIIALALSPPFTRIRREEA